MKKLFLVTEQEKNKILSNYTPLNLKEQFVEVGVDPKDYWFKHGKNIKSWQSMLKCTNSDLGTSGVNKDGVDGFWGEKSQSALDKVLGISGAKKDLTNFIVLLSKTGYKCLPNLDAQKGIEPKTTLKSKVDTSIGTPSKKLEKKFAEKITGTEQILNPNAYLKFDGEKLEWVSDGNVLKSWKAISGLTWKNTPFSNWPEMLKRYYMRPSKWAEDKNAGPIPPGNYTVGPLEKRGNTSDVSILKAIWDKFFTGKYDNVSPKDTLFQANTEYSKISWGDYRLKINSNVGTVTHGRGDFYVHGGSFEGSHGCIDLTDSMEDFAKFFGTWSTSTNKKTIPLVVDYSNKVLNKLSKSLWTNLSGTNPYREFKLKNPKSLDPGKI